MPSAAGTSWTMCESEALGISKLGNPAGIFPTSAMPWAAKSNPHESAIAATTRSSAPGSFGTNLRSANSTASDTALTATVGPLTLPSSLMTSQS